MLRLSYEGDLVEAQDWLGKAQQELGRLRERMALGQRAQGKFQHALSDTAYAYGGILPNGFEWIHIVTSPGVKAPTDAPLYKPTTPDFISGLCTDARIDDPTVPTKPARLHAFYPTRDSVRLHPKELNIGLCKPARLAVDAGPTYSTLSSVDANSQLHYSQLRYVIPTRYSGKMRAVVQALLGFGKQQGPTTKDGIRSIYDLAKPHLIEERATDQRDMPTKWQRAVAKDGLQVWYDFRFSRTHGITVGLDGKLWLVEISGGRGIVAMPLPLWPLTMTPEFRSKVEAMGDTDAVKMIDELGGFPTGEHFPVNAKEFDAYVDAGRIVRLLPASGLADFYSNEMYGSGVGWAFSENGHEAHNTAFNYRGGFTRQLGVHYACNLSIGAALDTNPGTATQKQERTARRLRLKHQFAALLNAAEFKDTFEAAMWKIDRMNDSELLDVEASIGGLRERMRALVAKKLTPLATAHATCGKMGEGYLWSKAHFVGQPQIKFPEMELGYLLSHDFNPSDAEGNAHPVLCDTTMFVFFKGGELVHVKFYFNPETHEEATHYDENEECMYVGTWMSRDTHGLRNIPAGFYTSEFDDRKEMTDSETVNVLTGKDLGWCGGVIQDDPVNPAQGWVSRDRAYLMTTTNILTSGRSWNSAIAIPMWEREGYYYATLDGFAERRTHTEQYYSALMDPNYARYWRYFMGFGGTLHGGQYPSGCGALGTQRKVVELLYKPYPCSDLVDEGQSFNLCQVVDHYAYYTLGDLPPASNTYEPQTKHQRVMFSCSSRDFPEVVVSDITLATPDAGYWNGGLWFVSSPDENGDTQFITATRNSLGTSELIWIGKDINSGKYFNFGGPLLLPDGSKPPNFVGVING